MIRKYKIWASAVMAALKYRKLTEYQTAKIPLIARAHYYRAIMVPAWREYYEELAIEYERQFGK